MTHTVRPEVRSLFNWTKYSNIISFVGKFFISGAYSISYLLSAEQFPTSIRNAGLGMSSVMARIGGILCPYILITQGKISKVTSNDLKLE